jgi:hypothetical protein
MIIIVVVVGNGMFRLVVGEGGFACSVGFGLWFGLEDRVKALGYI